MTPVIRAAPRRRETLGGTRAAEEGGVRRLEGLGLADVQAVYDGAEGDLWELLMGEQIHVGGLRSTLELAERAGVGAGQEGVDLCCCSGAGMRALVRLRDVAAMTGVDACERVIERGRVRSREQGVAERLRFERADVCRTPLPEGAFDFAWGEDAWCYVADKPALVAEAVRLVRPGGVIAFTDWVEGPGGLDDAEAERLLRFMKFPTFASPQDYAALLEGAGCELREAADTGRFAPHADLYAAMGEQQLTYDALRILDFDEKALAAVAGEMAFLRELAHAGKVIQGRFVALRR